MGAAIVAPCEVTERTNGKQNNAMIIIQLKERESWRIIKQTKRYERMLDLLPEDLDNRNTTGEVPRVCTYPMPNATSVKQPNNCNDVRITVSSPREATEKHECERQKTSICGSYVDSIRERQWTLQVFHM